MSESRGVVTVSDAVFEQKQHFDVDTNMPTFEPKIKRKGPSLIDFMQMNRAARRRIGKLNKVKIPGIDLKK